MNDHDDMRDDPLAALAAAWSQVEAPEPADELADADADTQRAVAWMQAGWAAIETPELVIPERLTARAKAPRRLRLLEGTGRSLAAAALLLVMLGAPLLLTDDDAPGLDGFDGFDDTGITPPVLVRTDLGGTDAVADPGRAARPHPQVVALGTPSDSSDTPAPTGLELRSGSVRLLLVGSATAGL